MITCTPRRDRSTLHADDAALVGDLASGLRQTEVLAELHRRHASRLHTVLQRRFGDAGAAEDAVQETFVRVWRKAGLYDPAHGSVAAWMHGIAVRAAIDQHRRRGRSVATVSVDEGALDACPRTVRATTDHEVVERQAMSEALLRLTLEHREVLFLAHQGGYTQSEIATILAVPLGTVKTRTYWALRALKRHLGSMSEVALST